MSEQSRRKPVHDGRVLLVADGGLKPGESLTPAAATAIVDDFYQRIGGADFFRRLTNAFYGLVAEDDVLSPLFPRQDWDRQARTLFEHFVRLWEENDLTEAWRPGLHRMHAHWVITRQQRLRWLELMRKAGEQVDAPADQFTEFMTLMKVASGEMMAVSRGAAIARHESFHWDGTPADGTGNGRP